MMCDEGLVKSKSKRPTLQPFLASDKAKTEATRLLPTPPFPLDTAMTFRIFLSLSSIIAVLGSVKLFRSSYAFDPDPAALEDLEVWASAHGAFDVGVGDLRDEVDGFACFFVEVSFS